MRRAAILIVIALAFTTAPPAGARPDCVADPEHPSCKDVGDPGDDEGFPTCEPVFAVPTHGSQRLDCEWTPTEEAVDSGTVSVTTSGEVTRLAIFVRDSSPGNICVLEETDPTSGEAVVSFELETSGETYWANKTDWCSRFDPYYHEDRVDMNGDPLHLTLLMRGKKGSSIEVSLEPVPETP